MICIWSILGKADHLGHAQKIKRMGMGQTLLNNLNDKKLTLQGLDSLTLLVKATLMDVGWT